MTNSYKPLGHQQISNATLASATALTIPAAGTDDAGSGMTTGQRISTAPRARYALIHCEGVDVRYRDDGTNPDASTGMVLKAGAYLWYDGNLPKLKFIRTASGSTLDVAYYA